MLRAIRLVLRLLTTATLSVGLAFGSLMIVGDHWLPLRWTTAEGSQLAVEDAMAPHYRRVGDVPIEVTHDERTVVHWTGAERLGDGVRDDGRSLIMSMNEATLEAGDCIAFVPFLQGGDGLALQGAWVTEGGVTVAERSRYSPRERSWITYVDYALGQRASWGGSLAIGWCSPAGGRVRLMLRFVPGGRTPARPFEAVGGDHVVHLIVGRSAAPAQLSIGFRFATFAGERVWETALDPVDTSTVIGETVRSSWTSGVVLMPASPAVWGALADMSARGSGRFFNVRVDERLRHGGLPFGRPDAAFPRGEPPPVSDPVIRWRGASWRVLAAVDMGALDTPCARIALSRSTLGESAPEVSVVEVPSLRSSTLTPEEGTSTDPRCAARGLRLYLVPETDRAGYRVRVLRGEAPEDLGAAEPSTYAGPLPIAREGECEAGDIEACEQVGLRLGFWPAYAPTRRAEGRALLEQTCAAGRENACLGAALLSDPVDRAVLEQQCDGDGEFNAAACMHLGESFRNEARRTSHTSAENREAALAAYARACRAGSQDGCHNATARYP